MERIIDTGVTETDLSRLLDEVAALIEQPRDPAEFTAREYADHQGITYDVAKNKLERAYRDGTLTRRAEGRNWYYRKA